MDCGVQQGDEVSIHYDPMLAKVIAYAESRPAAIARLVQALRATVILGVTTNLDFLVALLESDVFASGQVTTSTIEQRLDDFLLHPATEYDPQCHQENQCC